MNKCWFLLALLMLSGCAQRCDCDAPTKQASQAQPTESKPGEQRMAEAFAEPSVDSDGFVLAERPMAEAAPAGTVEQPSQLDKVAADPNAKPFLPVTVPATKRRLTRPLLPSEFPPAVDTGMAYSAYPSLNHSKKQLTDYASQLGFKLAAFDALKGARVGVTSFVEFDDNLQTSNPLGNQFAEAMVSTLPQHGVVVVDFKLTRKITVSKTGDFSMSRNIRELSDKSGMDYILTGTLVTTRRGVQVHSRVISVRSQQVIASATTLLPHLVLQQIQP